MVRLLGSSSTFYETTSRPNVRPLSRELVVCVFGGQLLSFVDRQPGPPYGCCRSVVEGLQGPAALGWSDQYSPGPPLVVCGGGGRSHADRNPRCPLRPRRSSLRGDPAEIPLAVGRYGQQIEPLRLIVPEPADSGGAQIGTPGQTWPVLPPLTRDARQGPWPPLLVDRMTNGGISKTHQIPDRCGRDTPRPVNDFTSTMPDILLIPLSSS